MMKEIGEMLPGTENHPSIVLNRIPGEEVRRMVEKPCLLPRKGNLNWAEIPDRIIVYEGEAPHVFGMIFTAFFGLAGMFVFLGLAMLGGFVLAQSVRHAITAGWSSSALMQALRVRLG